MILKMYSILDSKGEAFGTPFFCLKQGIATRYFQQMVADDRTLLRFHPADFTLFEVGEFDDATGVVKAVQHVNLGNAVRFVPKVGNEGPILGKDFVEVLKNGELKEEGGDKQ